MAEEFPAVETTSSGRVLEIPTRGRTPNVNDDVFISVDDTVEKIKELLAERVVFIRAAVASGKTTLAQYLVNELPNEFVEVEDGSSAQEWYEEFIRVSGRNDLGGARSKIKAREALREIGRQGKTIVIDEAHFLFDFPEVVKVLIKDMEKAGKPRILLSPPPRLGITMAWKQRRHPKSQKSTCGIHRFLMEALLLNYSTMRGCI